MKQKKNRTTIGYRLDDDRLTKLESLAKKEGVSVHEKARQVMIATLDERDAKEERQELALAEVQSAVDEMRERSECMEFGIRETFVALFQRMGAANETEARAFIELVFSGRLQQSKESLAKEPLAKVATH